ncbi:winged helix-turn-helix transcriptional regulator [Hymenobacter radiodurans]
MEGSTCCGKSRPVSGKSACSTSLARACAGLVNCISACPAPPPACSTCSCDSSWPTSSCASKPCPRPLTVEYHLTGLGESLLPLLTALGRWGDEHQAQLRRVVAQSAATAPIR